MGNVSIGRAAEVLNHRLPTENAENLAKDVGRRLQSDFDEH